MKNFVSIFLALLGCHATAQILKDCSSCSLQIVKKEQIKNLSIDEIRFLTNDLYARKGYRFKTATIDFYFSNKEWYKPTDNNESIQYNDIEKKNLKTFQDRTSELKADRDNLLYKLKAFKTAFVKNDNNFLKAEFGYTADDELHRLLLEVLNNINLEDLNWFKKESHYEIKVDKLAETISYKININDTKIGFTYDYDSGSEIIEDTLYPSDYNAEFTHFWEFEWTNGNLKFLRVITAG